MHFPCSIVFKLSMMSDIKAGCINENVCLTFSIVKKKKKKKKKKLLVALSYTDLPISVFDVVV